MGVKNVAEYQFLKAQSRRWVMQSESSRSRVEIYTPLGRLYAEESPLTPKKQEAPVISSLHEGKLDE